MDPGNDLTPAAAPTDGAARTQADLNRVAGGDTAAFGSLWQRFRPALVMLLITRFRAALEPALRVRFDDELDDLVQETAARVVADLGNFNYRGNGSLLAWMSTIAVRVADDRLDYWRAGKRHPRRDRPLTEGDASRSDAPRGDFHALADLATTPASAAAAAERRRRLAAALGGLSERHQQVVAMRFFCGAEWSEVAEVVGAPSGDAVAMECLRQVFPRIAAGLASIDRAM